MAAAVQSRWVRLPEHVDASATAACRPASAPPASPRAQALRRAATSACSSATPPATVSAARFTRSGVLAAPVLVSQERAALDALRAVVVNSGNANAATGRRGFEDAARCRAPRRWPPASHEDQVAVASTGVIGVPLRRPTRSSQGIAGARAASCARTATATSPRRSAPPTGSPRSVAVDVELPSGTVRLTAQAKGAGMISPDFATMLCFVQTDAALAPRPPTCCSASASSAPSTASRSTASCRPTTP